LHFDMVTADTIPGTQREPVIRQSRARHPALAATAAFIAWCGVCAGAACAQMSNSIGIYATASADQAEIVPAPLMVPFNIYFVLTDPRTPSGTPVTAIDGFEFLVRITGPHGSLLRLNELTPPSTINVGDHQDPFYSTYKCNWPTPNGVYGGLVTLMTWQLIIVGPSTPYYMYLEPASPATIPNQLCFGYRVGANHYVRAATGTQALYSQPVFAIGAYLNPPVAGESMTFGGIKALFR
jgi:hypothetical protein